jgi:hypothetical protein
MRRVALEIGIEHCASRRVLAPSTALEKPARCVSSCPMVARSMRRSTDAVVLEELGKRAGERPINASISAADQCGDAGAGERLRETGQQHWCGGIGAARAIRPSRRTTMTARLASCLSAHAVRTCVYASGGLLSADGLACFHASRIAGEARRGVQDAPQSLIRGCSF